MVESSNQSYEPWFGKYADELCPYYVSIGVSFSDYWYGDSTMLQSYVQAEEYRKERDNESAWLQGMYVYEAVGCLAPLLHAFAKNGTKPGKYPKKPYAVTERQRIAEEHEEKIANQAGIQSRVMGWVNGMRRKFKDKEVKDDGGRNN